MKQAGFDTQTDVVDRNGARFLTAERAAAGVQPPTLPILDRTLAQPTSHSIGNSIGWTMDARK